ncbi:MAG TPA: 16S rRNA (adenine(1518)-N(6)/adenine(1519)-N(6))-dimethyltransferase RsmA [Nitrososphaerales archaeon]|nr:16S rRNA (adenine(1518)-N(6)/adenine(1519)-N(6))-dimethyltransferase RsmA [Nitrososphaerales archaeon]
MGKLTRGPKRIRLGQHNLVSPTVAKRMIELASIHENETVLEIGTGKGMLTRQIAATGNPVMSFEIDPALYKVAIGELSAYSNVTLLFGDFFSTQKIVNFDVLITSLPYSRSLDLVEWLAGSSKSIRCAVVLAQREFVEKLLAIPGSNNYRAVSVICQTCFLTEKFDDVSASDFSPSPKVSSCIVRFSTRGDQSPCLNLSQIKLLKLIFSFRGKKLRSALRSMKISERNLTPSSSDFLNTRIEKLTPSDFLSLLNLEKMSTHV